MILTIASTIVNIVVIVTAITTTMLISCITSITIITINSLERPLCLRGLCLSAAAAHVSPLSVFLVLLYSDVHY